MPVEPTNLVDLGVGAAVALLMLKEVFTFVREMVSRRNGNGSSAPSKMEAGIKEITRTYFEPTLRMVSDLHIWHNVTDSDGVKIWYVRPSLSVAIKELATNISAQTDVLKEMIRLQNVTIDRLESKDK